MSAPTSPSAARRYTSPPPPTSPNTIRAGSVKPATPERPAKAATPAPASPPKPSPKKSEDDKDNNKDKSSTPAPAPAATTPAPAASTENVDVDIPDVPQGEDIDEAVFGQITEMDDDDDDFSSDIVRDYFKQAVVTFKEIEDALNSKDFNTLSSKGHFLKGSSAALGVKKVQGWCEHIQHYGNLRDEVKGIDLSEQQALRGIELIMPKLKKDYESAKVWLINYYKENDVDL